ncbi:MAG: GGDEF domain-containing protein [Rhodobacteraceae bacterium]|nr:GGDEF domain-containing protein [Paracoccaceae bacterium]
MGQFSNQPLQALRRQLRSVLVGPQLAAFLPALFLGAYWYGGEGLLLFLAIVFPALLGLSGLMTRPGAQENWPVDAVTGLPLREAMLAQFDRGFEKASPGKSINQVCLVLEVDDAPQLRARHGHIAADQIMREVSDRLRDMSRPEDLVTSLAYGRFGLVLKGGMRMDLEAMIGLCGRLQSAVGEPYSVDDARVLVTSCIGFCLPSRTPSQNADAYLNAGENALEAAQRSGPGSLRAYTASMHKSSGPSSHTGKEVLKALEEGQIVAWFQPQISTDTGTLTGFEALARWQHPQKGQIAPSTFLPAIGNAGLFERLGEVMLFKSLTALRDWDNAGLNVPNVSVNLSADELRNPKLFDKIRWELDRFELAPERLTLEILENVVADSEDDTATRNIAALSRLGCQIDLDDFGTGHASITNIRRFDVNRIKIDRSFITHVDNDRDQQSMVAAILTMAERLGVETVGEGVESVGEHAMLAQLGCNHVQGYWIGKPMPFEETAGWITELRAKTAEAPSLKKQA